MIGNLLSYGFICFIYAFPVFLPTEIKISINKIIEKTFLLGPDTNGQVLRFTYFVSWPDSNGLKWILLVSISGGYARDGPGRYCK
jgi:hypothetical protein